MITKKDLQGIAKKKVTECKSDIMAEKLVYAEKGELIFFQHGLYSDRTAFESTIGALKLDTDFNYAGIMTKRDSDYPGEVILKINFEESIFIDRLISKGIMRDKRDTTLRINQINLDHLKEVVNTLLQEGYNLMVHSEFSDNNASHQQQISELNEFITALNPAQSKVVLIGHSKGGIVSVGYTASDLCQDRVSKIITVGTPYHPNAFAKLASSRAGEKKGAAGEGTRDLAGWTKALETIKTNWNSKKVHERVSAHAIGCILNPGVVVPASDGVVPLEAQHAKGFDGITAHTVRFLFDTFEPTFHCGETSNAQVISKLKALVLGTSRAVYKTPFFKQAQRCEIESSLLSEVRRTIDVADRGRREHIGGLQERCEDNRKSKEDLNRMLLYAVNKGLFNSTKVIVEKLKEFNMIDIINSQETSMGLRPLHMAVLKNHTDIAMYLIEQLETKYLHSKNIDGINVFQMAAYMGNTEVLSKLIEKAEQTAIKAINEKNSPNDQDVLAFNSFDVAFSMHIAINTAEELHTERPDITKKILEANFGIVVDDTIDIVAKISALKQRCEDTLEVLRENGGELSDKFSTERQCKTSWLVLNTIDHVSDLAKSFDKKGPSENKFFKSINEKYKGFRARGNSEKAVCMVM